MTLCAPIRLICQTDAVQITETWDLLVCVKNILVLHAFDQKKHFLSQEFAEYVSVDIMTADIFQAIFDLAHD